MNAGPSRCCSNRDRLRFVLDAVRTPMGEHSGGPRWQVGQQHRHPSDSPRGHETLHSTTLGWRMVNPRMSPACTPVFRPDGTVTAGNCSPLNDGAAALLLGEEETSRRTGKVPLAHQLSGGWGLAAICIGVRQAWPWCWRLEANRSTRASCAYRLMPSLADRQDSAYAVGTAGTWVTT